MERKDDITAYMERMGFGDYSKADGRIREEMEDAALSFAAKEQAQPSIFAGIALDRARAAYADGTADAHGIRTLLDSGDISADDASAYYAAHGWTLPKFGLR